MDKFKIRENVRGGYMIKYIAILLLFSLRLFAENNVTKGIFQEVIYRLDKLSKRENENILRLEETKKNYMIGIRNQPLLIESLIDSKKISNKKKCYKKYFYLKRIDKEFKYTSLVHNRQFLELAKFFFKECKVIRLDLLNKLDKK